ncbi:hypothetical protein DVT68_06090 [Dyella solisilvae]|uniref:Uncharacterized protein n=1 Tax=Dyella solisilvae TaxID=1920168 RepID=A0A370KD61_9GAMM|nr:hypothetical protein [Dyella solisilvae]RDJ00368.1 hypothetical protein DVT68_06090 [Dyella solisilvae]
MNKTDVIRQVATRTGLPPALCEAALKAFEATCGDALTGAFTGQRHNHSHVVAEMVHRTGASAEDCAQLLKAFEQVLDEALRDKLGFKGKRPR